MKHQYRVRDSNFLADTLQKVTQITSKIEELCTEDSNPKDLPHSLVPTEVLYSILIAYESMHSALVNRELVIEGQHRANKRIH